MLLILPLVIPITYIIHFLVILFTYMVLSTSWNIIGGYAGQINFGHAAFFGIGAYVTALLWRTGVEPLIGMVLSGVVAALFAVGISPCFRLKGAYFAIGTLGLAEVLKIVMLNWEFTGRAAGMMLPIPPEYSIIPYYYIALAILIANILVTLKVIGSRIGFAFTAIRDNEDAASALGVNPLYYKIVALALSAFFAGIAGGFYTYFMLYIEPHTVFSINWTAGPLFAVIIGGPGTIIGPLIGTVIYVSVTELLVALGAVSLIVAGIILILIIIFFPTGIAGVLRRLLASPSATGQEVKVYDFSATKAAIKRAFTEYFRSSHD